MASELKSVNRGDLITSELMNSIIGELAALQVRVTDLESAAGVMTGHVVIFEPLPGEQFRVGQDMTIKGRNFSFSSGGSVVSFDNTLVTAYKAGSGDDCLVFTIPELVPKIGAEGRDVILTVSNKISAAQRAVRLLPAQALSGAIDVVWLDAYPVPFHRNDIVAFKLKAKSRANLGAEYEIEPVITRVANPSAWNGRLEVVDDSGTAIGSRRVAVPAGKEQTFQVRLNKVPDVDDGTPFALSVAASAGAVMGTTGPLRMTVGDQINLPDPEVSCNFSSAIFDPVDSGIYIPGVDEDRVRLKSTGAVQITLSVEFRATGVYEVGVKPVNDASVTTSGWSLERHPQDQREPFTIEPEMLNNTQKKHIEMPRFILKPLDDATDMGEVEFEIHNTESNVSRILLMKLALVK